MSAEQIHTVPPDLMAVLAAAEHERWALCDLAHDALKAIPGVSGVTPVGGGRPVEGLS